MTVPPPARLTHVGLYVNDMGAMVAFYTELLGLVVTDRGELFGRELTFLSRDPGEHHQLVLVTGRRAPEDVAVLSQLSFRLDDEDLSALRWFARRAEQLGARDMDPRNHGNSWSVYFLDPEGNRLEIYTSTPWYVSQPWREPLDLEDSDAVIRSTTRHLIEQTATAWSPVDEWTAVVAAQLASAERPSTARATQPSTEGPQ
jgi:catechol 2,3-dioxygenase-like lactoylglutathione lyase family enzyme